jgi:hypothetical protein
MFKIPNMLEENVDYELIPGDEEHWHIRIKTGEFIESVISFGNIKFDDKTAEMKFDFNMHFSPDGDLSVDSVDFQKYAGKILESILINNLNEMENNE